MNFKLKLRKTIDSAEEQQPEGGGKRNDQYNDNARVIIRMRYCVDNIVVSVFVVILVDLDKCETSRLE